MTGKDKGEPPKAKVKGEEGTVKGLDAASIPKVADRPAESRGWTAFKLIFPFALSALFIALLYISLDWRYFARLGSAMVAYFFPPLGKESVIPIAIGAGIEPLMIALTLTFIDTVVAIFLAWNFKYILKVPFFGHLLRYLEKKGKQLLREKKWVSGAAFTAVVLFVMVPFQGSGGAGASIFGNMIGMKPGRIILAVEIGALSGTLMIAYLSSTVMELVGKSLMAGMIALLVIVIVGVVYYFKKDEVSEYFGEKMEARTERREKEDQKEK